MADQANDVMQFISDTHPSGIIKVIGVGGGGGNAVKNMYKEGIHDVTFVLCNTDKQALLSSDIPVKVQLGPKTTKGLGAGSSPEVAREAAEESIEDIRDLFRDETQMVFITAGMGGGTGTGAAPVVARIAKEMGMLTIGIVTIPFIFEKKKKIVQALRGVEAIAKHVDALLVINNERLLEIYPKLPVRESFRLADRTLTTATKSIAEIITTEGIINLDFRDVSKILKDGGVAIMSNGTGKGEKRLENAIENALHSPLLNNNDIYNSKRILFNIYESAEKPLAVEEMEEIDKFMAKFEDNDIEVIWGLAEDKNLKDEVKFTVLATGFGMNNIPGMEEAIAARKEEEEKRSEREQQKKEEEEQILIGKFYRDYGNQKRPIRTFIFQDEDLDNDDLIDSLESSPTYERTSSELDALEDKRSQQDENDAAGNTPDNGTGISPIIF